MAARVPLGMAVAGSYRKKQQVSAHVNVLVFVVIRSLQSYFEVSRDVCSRQDADGRGEENGKHLEKVALWSSPVWFQVLNKDLTC